MTIDEARTLFAYDSWANALCFTAAQDLGDQELAREVESSFPSVLATLGHIVAAEWVWLRRWKGENPTAIPDWVSGSGLTDLRARLAGVEEERADLLNTLAEADLRTRVAYRTLAGAEHEDPLGDLMRHVVNHSTYHRGQVATQLRHLGRTPPTTDLIAYLRQSR